MKKILFLLGSVGLIAMSCCPDENNDLPTPPNDSDTTLVEVNDTVSFDVIPLTSLSEQAVSEFKALTEGDFLATTGGGVYGQNIEYVCFRENGKTFYVPVDFWEEPFYNVYEGLDGRTGRYITFYDGYTSVQYNTWDSKDAVIAYHSYVFDEPTQKLVSEAVDGHEVKENVYTLVYADADYIVLESEIRDAAIERLELPGNRDYFIRELLVRYTGELKEPTIVEDYRD